MSLAHRDLFFTLTNDTYSDASLLKVTAFEFDEGLSTLFSGRTQFSSELQKLSEDQFLDKDICLHIFRNGKIEREFHGIVKSFQVRDKGNKDQFYEVIIIPSLGRLAYRKNYQIFQGRDIKTISEQFFSEIGLTDYAWALRHTHTAREYCVQYDEVGLQFLQRIWAEEGLFYYFEHEEDKHTLVLTDDTSTLNALPFSPEYNANSGGLMNDAYIYQFAGRLQMAQSEVVMRDYYFKKPSSQLETQKYSNSGLSKISDYEHYDFPGRYVEDAVGKVFSAARVHFLRRDARTGGGQSNASYLLPGYTMSLQNHGEESFNGEWLLTHVRHKGQQPQSLESFGGEGMTTYSNSFAGIPSKCQWAPEPWVLSAINPKPLICGPQVAVVTGANGEEIYTDEFGRIKVKFPWDRYGSKDEQSSAWIRLNQEWAGQSYGALKIPRVGHEVIVDFLEGDPDQPIVIGTVYNATKRQPYKLPEHKTRTALRSKTHKGEGFNELTFEDQAAQQFIYQHAQKDMGITVKNDQVNHIINDQHLRIDNNLTEEIKETASFTYEKERNSSITGNDTHIVMGKYTQDIADNWITETGDLIDLEAGGKKIISAGSSITFKVGGSFMRIDPSGVYFVAPTVNILNGSGAGKSPKVSDLPKDPEVIKSMVFNLAHNYESEGLANESYAIYKNGEFMDSGYTDDKGNISIKHSPNAKDYKIEFFNGEEYSFEIIEEYEKGVEGALQKMKGMGFRIDPDSDDPKKELIRIFQSALGNVITGSEDDIEKED